MNPFQLTPEKLTDQFMDWQSLYSGSYDKMAIDPYTRVRVILMNGTEFESCWYSHQFHRHESNNDLRRELAVLRRQEQQQQKKIACLKPLDETMLEHTIGYEQLAVDLTAMLAQRVTCAHVKSALDFALLEDFDHLYRYADLLEMEHGVYAEKLVGSYTEIMPGRPTISEHRAPFDALCQPGKKDAALFDKMAVQIITAAEQQTMNYYMNICGLYTSDLGRRLYQEIGQIEEQHVTQYGSLMDPNCTWLEGLLMHQYVEAYLYYSCMEDETDPLIKKVWERFFQMEVAHLHKAAQLLKTYEKKDWQQVIPNGEFPAPLHFQSNIAYVRSALNMVDFTAEKEIFKPVHMLPRDYDFFHYQQAVNQNVRDVPSHLVIDQSILKNGRDYRAETAPNPIPALQNRAMDNTTLGRMYQ
ncbi:MAG: hypothetical protein E7329_08430 [Clostridiales bacterium]|nr:hypothetical protein [Clostridiales bacterium]